MSIEELLLPRYKVMVDYPDSEFQVGEILLQCKDGIRLVSLTRSMYADWFKIDKWPHLFKKLEWWEDRTPEEMPEYIKLKGRVYQIDEAISLGKMTKDCEPATEAEYLAYQQQIKQP